ncbi:Uncharacterized protein FKW44_006177, partial [Caligus rogercresseyi]
ARQNVHQGKSPSPPSIRLPIGEDSKTVPSSVPGNTSLSTENETTGTKSKIFLKGKKPCLSSGAGGGHSPIVERIRSSFHKSDILYPSSQQSTQSYTPIISPWTQRVTSHPEHSPERSSSPRRPSDEPPQQEYSNARTSPTPLLK